MIVFVGDQPSSKNIDPKIPFVGTKSYAMLLQWIAILELDIYDVMIFNQSDLEVTTYQQGWPHDFTDSKKTCETRTVIALGNKASLFLDCNGVRHFKLLHPSGLNRKLNDKKYVKKILRECKKWLIQK